MPSKLITDRQKSASAVVAAAHSHAARATAALTELFEPVAAKGQKLPDLSLLFSLSAAALERATGKLVEADVEHERELADDDAPRAKRDELAAEVYADLIELREVVTGLLGSAAVPALRLTGTTPRDPVVLARLVRDVSAALSSQKLPKSRVRGATFRADDWVARLEERAKPLEKAIEVVAREAREAEGTLATKNRAMDAFDETFRKVATLLSASLSIAGEDELASRVRPTARRPGRTAESEVDPEDPPSTPVSPTLSELEPSV